MKCIFCHGEEISPSQVSEEIPAGPDIVHVPITVLLCGTCGERYYDRATMRHLEQVRQDVSKNRADLEEVGKVLRIRGSIGGQPSAP